SLANLPTLTGLQRNNLLVISQESAKVINVDRSGAISSSLTIHGDADNPLTVPEQTNEGVTMDDDGFLYVVNEQGGGDLNHPHLWVYAPSSAPNAAPTAVTLTNQVTRSEEHTSELQSLTNLVCRLLLEKK